MSESIDRPDAATMDAIEGLVKQLLGRCVEYDRGESIRGVDVVGRRTRCDAGSRRAHDQVAAVTTLVPPDDGVVAVLRGVAVRLFDANAASHP